MSTFAQRRRSGHSQRRRSSIQTLTSTSAKTDLESVRYSPDDSAKIRKIKFIFRVIYFQLRKKFKIFQ